MQIDYFRELNHGHKEANLALRFAICSIRLWLMNLKCEFVLFCSLSYYYPIILGVVILWLMKLTLLVNSL